MAGFFYELGKMVGPGLRKAGWVYRSVAGTEAEAARAEYAVGRDLARALTEQLEVERDPAVAALLDDLGARLTGCLKQPRAFAFRAVHSAEVNAFALPGGFVFVTRGLLDFSGGDRDELAFVLGHEMAHVVRRHAIDRLLAHSVLGAAIRRLTPGGLLQRPLAGLAGTLLNRGYSREQELEADRLGVRLVHCAGLDTTAAARLLARLQALAGDVSVMGSYLSSHPPAAVRIGQLKRLPRG